VVGTAVRGGSVGAGGAVVVEEVVVVEEPLADGPGLSVVVEVSRFEATASVRPPSDGSRARTNPMAATARTTTTMSPAMATVATVFDDRRGPTGPAAGA